MLVIYMCSTAKIAPGQRQAGHFTQAGNYETFLFRSRPWSKWCSQPGSGGQFDLSWKTNHVYLSACVRILSAVAVSAHPSSSGRRMPLPTTKQSPMVSIFCTWYFLTSLHNWIALIWQEYTPSWHAALEMMQVSLSPTQCVTTLKTWSVLPWRHIPAKDAHKKWPLGRRPKRRTISKTFFSSNSSSFDQRLF